MTIRNLLLLALLQEAAEMPLRLRLRFGRMLVIEDYKFVSDEAMDETADQYLADHGDIVDRGSPVPAAEQVRSHLAQRRPEVLSLFALYRLVARRRAIDLARRRRREEKHPPDFWTALTEAVGDASRLPGYTGLDPWRPFEIPAALWNVLTDRERHVISEIRDALNERHRLVYWVSAIDSRGEITDAVLAEHFGVEENTIRVWLHRACETVEEVVARVK